MSTTAPPSPPPTPRPMPVRFLVVARTTPELIERVCRTLRHRGATVEHLLVTPGCDHVTTLDITAHLDGDPSLLLRHVKRLTDVRETVRLTGPDGPRLSDERCNWPNTLTCSAGRV